jgi:hypothetical protein
MAINYHFQMDEQELSYTIELDRKFDPAQVSADAAEWTQLSHCQCAHCPLSRVEYNHCPAAVDLQKVVEDFQNLPAVKKAKVRVVTPDREYLKEVELDEGVRSLMGVIMATSACPILEQLKPNAFHHLPFATMDEFVMRSTSMYLMRQYFRYRGGEQPDWELQGLIRLNQDLQQLNQAFWQRIHSGCESDSNLKALLSFFNLSSSLSYSLEAQLQRIKPMVSDLDNNMVIGDHERKAWQE